MEFENWVQVLQKNFSDLPRLLDFCKISENERSAVLFNSRFPMSVPFRFAEKMKKGTIHDPLFRQFVPLKEEEGEAPGFSKDPLQEEGAKCCGKLLHKYSGRALIIATRACGMHCRFCFRRHFAYEEKQEDFTDELSWLQQHEEIEEVIFSGGDPFALPTPLLERLCTSVAALAHVKRMRFHTRLPIGIPERIDTALLDCFQKLNTQLFIVFHVNHPFELDEDVLGAFQRLSSLGIKLLSQTVLLAGVNDCADVLATLMRALGNCGVIPYYLHQLDRVKGASHFEVSSQKGLTIINDLHRRLSGYLVPRYVQEIPGQPGKTAVATFSQEL